MIAPSSIGCLNRLDSATLNTRCLLRCLSPGLITFCSPSARLDEALESPHQNGQGINGSTRLKSRKLRA